VDLVDTDFRVILPVPPKPAVIFLSLIVKDPNLGFLTVPENRSLNAGGLQYGTSDLDFVLIREKKHFPETDGAPRFGVHLLHPYDFPGCHPILLASRFDHCIHESVSSFRRDRGRPSALKALPKRYVDSF